MNKECMKSAAGVHSYRIQQGKAVCILCGKFEYLGHNWAKLSDMKGNRML